MELLEAMERRHAVRAYTDKKIEGSTAEALQDIIAACNREGELHIRLCLQEERAFHGLMARYGKFKNVRNYIALIGKDDEKLDEKCGYYGEKIVLEATKLGLQTCWVAVTSSKSKVPCTVKAGERLCCVIAIGYGQTEGTAHRSKPLETLYQAAEPVPSWFLAGVKAAQLAPTALNQQKFRFVLRGNTVTIEVPGGAYTKIDEGIVKYHFEVGADMGSNGWKWEAC